MHLTSATAAELAPPVVALVASILPDWALRDYPAASPPANRFQHGVLNALLAHGIETTVIALQPVSSYPRSPLFFRGVEGALDSGAFRHQIGFINAGPLKTLTAAVTSFFALWQWARQNRANRRVILFYNAYNPSAWVGIAVSWLCSCRMMAIVADVRVPGSGGRDASLLRRIEYWIAVASLRHMDAIVSVTRQVVTDFAKDVPSLLLDGGVPDDMLGQEQTPAVAESRHGADSVRPQTKPFVVLYAGSLTELAGVPLLLEAFELLVDLCVSLWITGAGELEALVRDAAAKDPRIQYLGYLPRSELLAKYHVADVLVNPHSTVLLTARYVFPSKLLEYLASGRPVITTATSEIAANYGELCTVLARDEPKALAEAISQVAATPESERLARAAAARANVVERRAWTQQGRRLVQFLEEHAYN